MKILKVYLVLFALISIAGCVQESNNSEGNIVLTEQGSFAVGGTLITSPGEFDPIAQGAFNPAGPDSRGQSLHGDHAYVSYQFPENSHKLPLVLWHGHGQSGKTWESTPDGREGFDSIFLRKNYSVYIMDQPRRGRAARSTEDITIPAAPDEQLWFGIFRLGVWPDFYEGVQFSREPEALNQFFRQMVPNTGPYNPAVNRAAVSALFDRIGDGVLVTHSQSGGPGWFSALENNQVRGVVSFEPGGDFLFPEGDYPSTMQIAGRTINLPTVPLDEFMRLTEIPILIYFGDNIPDEPSTNPGQEQWRAFLEVARNWSDVVNELGGDVTVIHLPDIGIQGNTHFPMSDMNNLEVADNMEAWLQDKGLF